MKGQGETHRSNTLMILVPGIFFGSALILRGNEDLTVLIWILFAVGAVTTIAVVLSFTTLIVSGKEIRIKNLKKSYVIHQDDIAKKSKNISTSKGIESVVWKLYLKSGEVVTISSDLFKEKENLKESLDDFLSSIPNK